MAKTRTIDGHDLSHKAEVRRQDKVEVTLAPQP
jgi:hypothetical protein